MAEATPITNDLLKGVMTDAMVYRGVCADFDIAMKTGYYEAAHHLGTKNYPPGAYKWGIVEVLNAQSFALQRYTPHQLTSSKAVYCRISNNGEWNPWVLLTGTLAT